MAFLSPNRQFQTYFFHAQTVKCGLPFPVSRGRGSSSLWLWTAWTACWPGAWAPWWCWGWKTTCKVRQRWLYTHDAMRSGLDPRVSEGAMPRAWPQPQEAAAAGPASLQAVPGHKNEPRFSEGDFNRRVSATTKINSIVQLLWDIFCLQLWTA